MLRERMDLFRRLVYIADLCIVALSFQLSIIINDIRLEVNINIFDAENMILPSLIIWGIVLWLHRQFYSVRLKSMAEIIRLLFKITVISSGLLLAFMFMTGYFGESRFQIIMFSCMSFILLAGFKLSITYLLYYFRSRGLNIQNVLIVGTCSQAKKFADKIALNLHLGWKIIGFLDWVAKPGLWRYNDIPCIGNLNDLAKILKGNQVDWVVFAVGRKYLEKIEKSIEICEEMGANAAVLANFFPARNARRKIDIFLDFPVICYNNGPRMEFPLAIKNIVDRALALLGVIVASPIMICVAAAVKLSSKGPVIFRQERRGLNGKKFTIYKFRTMVSNAEELKEGLIDRNEVDGHAFKMTNDPRITAIGNFLRRTSLDELPQLFNILKGDMSIVGPRPPLPTEVECYDHWQRRRLSMKPGLTGLWQVNGRSNVSFDRWMELDLNYIDNWSLWEDTKILAKTVPAVLRKTGAK